VGCGGGEGEGDEVAKLPAEASCFLHGAFAVLEGKEGGREGGEEGLVGELSRKRAARKSTSRLHIF